MSNPTSLPHLLKIISKILKNAPVRKYPHVNSTLLVRIISNEYFILNNIYIISGEKPYKCNHCSSSFAQRTSLNVHFNSHHKGLQPLSSPIKGKLFNKLQCPNIIQHLMSSNYCSCLKLDVFLNYASFTIVQDIIFMPHLIFLELFF